MTKTFETEINDKHRLLDLNSDSVNFELDFRVTSVDKSEFQAIVLAKTELDKYADLSEIKMKNCPGTIKGSITASDNNHENYFLVLRKENGSILANVEIDLRPIEMKEETVETANTSKSDNLFKRLLDDYFYHILFVVIACFIVYFTIVKMRPTSLIENNEGSKIEFSNPVNEILEKPVMDSPITPKVDNYLKGIENKLI
jgi:hypothetical protein